MTDDEIAALRDRCKRRIENASVWLSDTTDEKELLAVLDALDAARASNKEMHRTIAESEKVGVIAARRAMREARAERDAARAECANWQQAADHWMGEAQKAREAGARDMRERAAQIIEAVTSSFDGDPIHEAGRSVLARRIRALPLNDGGEHG